MRQQHNSFHFALGSVPRNSVVNDFLSVFFYYYCRLVFGWFDMINADQFPVKRIKRTFYSVDARF